MENTNMNRRDFIKSAITVAALAPVSNLAAKAGLDGNKASGVSAGPQVTRRQYKNTGMTLPLLGFGMMRLPQKGDKIDRPTAEAMVDAAMKAGCNYFDTAWMYHSGESEEFAGTVLSKYSRDSYYLISKLPVVMLKSPEDVPKTFEAQLKKCKTDYFDFYHFHWMNEDHWAKAKQLGAWEYLSEQKKAGRIRKLGFSFHGEPETLQKIATEKPWDLVQIQLNYLDWELCRSREQYEILTKLGIPVAVMEPLKGGTLVKLTPEACKVLKDANPEASIASWGLRYAASLPNVQVVLSGMSAPDHVTDNLKTFSPFKPLSASEQETIQKALAAYRKAGAIPCTACRYCSPCPVGVDIPRNLALLNQVKSGLPAFHAKLVYDAMDVDSRASSCVACGVCKKKCPQHIDIPKFMKEAADTFK